jgi:hypothetical protein
MKIYEIWKRKQSDRRRKWYAIGGWNREEIVSPFTSARSNISCRKNTHK